VSERERSARPAPPSRVQLLVTCLVDSIYPQVGFAVVEVLERLGLTVEVPAGQTCCGQPAFNSGGWDDARAMARHLIDVFGDHPDVPVVVPSGSCGDMVIHQAPMLLDGDPAYADRARALASRTFEFTQFLVDVLGVTDVGASSQGSVTYHPACHGLRGLGVAQQPLALLEAVGGVHRCPLPEAETCCGFGGLFAIKLHDVSASLLDRKIGNVEASGADTLVATDVSCLMHISGGLRRRNSPIRVRHLAELLAERSQAGTAPSPPAPVGARGERS
jgi:L-lactate dehydrogenase complex protein LldE